MLELPILADILFQRSIDTDSIFNCFRGHSSVEGVGGSMSKRYEALRGGGGGVTSALRNIIFF